MSQQFTFCPYCGAKNVLNAQFCANCGNYISEQQKLNIKPTIESKSYDYRTTAQTTGTKVNQSSESSSTSSINDSEIFGFIGIALAVLGCIGIIPLIGNIIAIILGHISLKRKINTPAKIALAFGYLGIILFVLIPIAIILAIFIPPMGP